MNDTAHTVRLRRASLDDISAINALINTCQPHNWTDDLHRLISTDGSYVFVFEQDTPVACVGVSFCQLHGQKVAHVFPYVVKPKLQRQGIGRTMLSAIRTFANRHAQSRGVDTLVLSMPSTHCPSDFAPYEPPVRDAHGFYLFKSPLSLTPPKRVLP